MRKQEIEKKLKYIVDNSVPDCFDEILAQCEKKKGFNQEVEIMTNKKKIENKNIFFGWRMAGAFAIITLIIGGLFGVSQYNKVYKTDSIVSFDVNPSVELKINKNKEIITTTPLNEDGKKVLAEMNLKKVDLDVAINAIIGSMLKNGYLTINENSILVSVKNDDVEKANKLKEEISQEIDEILKASSIYGSVLSQAYDKDSQAHELAIENEISEGKAHLIRNIIETNIKDRNGQVYKFEALSKLSINELNLLLSTKKTEIKDTNTQKQGIASESAYIGKEKAIDIALKNAGISINKTKNLEVELDADDGTLVYDVEFNVGNTEYEYEINAKTGTIIEKNIDKDDDNFNKTNHKYDDDDDDDDD